jgi:hypothetical protein
MAPKSGPKKRKPVLPSPIASEKELEAAREVLKDAAELKRQRSNMMYYLKSQGLENAYGAETAAAKGQFFENWLAEKMTKKGGTAESSSAHTVRSTDDELYDWMGKAELINRIGEAKACAQIESGKLKSRPDRVTDKEGEWLTEYKIWRSTGSKGESHEKKIGLTAADELDGDDAAERMKNMQEMEAAMMGGGGTSDAASSHEPPPALKKVKLEKSDEDGQPSLKLARALQSDAKPTMKRLQDQLVNVKRWFSQSKDAKYCEAFHEDLKKAVTKVAAFYKKVEEIVIDAKKLDDTEAVALGMLIQARCFSHTCM